MLILAFETSCDDTALAIVRNGTEVLSNIRQSQPDHNQYGGVVPEIAARLHAENWKKALEQALSGAQIKIEEIDALAVTQGPGLQTALLTGTSAASYLSYLYQKPIIPVHHILGHVTSTVLGRNAKDMQFPNLVLTVSGGHTSLYYRTSFSQVQEVGKTIDDAAGEAFDKCAKMLGLGYPGGPLVSQWAQAGNRQAYDFPRILLTKDRLDFSFSGLKAAVYRALTEQSKNTSHPWAESFTADICASFETTVSDILVKKVLRGFEYFPNAKDLHFVGGVSANTYIRTSLQQALAPKNISLLVPNKMSYCTDNAAMIAAAGYFLFQDNPSVLLPPTLIEADSRLKL